MKCLLLALLAGAAAACGVVGGDDQCATISSNLHPILFWGEVSVEQWVPNHAFATGQICQPQWFAPDTILVNTGRFNQGNWVGGIYSVLIDPRSTTYRGFFVHEFPYSIRDYDYNPATRHFVVAFARVPVSAEAVYATAVGSTLAAGDSVLGASWNPKAVRFADNDNVIAFATDPSSLVSGFYFHASDGSVDSLVQVVTSSRVPGFDVAGHSLVYADESTDYYRPGIVQVDLTGKEPPKRLFSVKSDAGAWISLGASATCAILGTYEYPETVVRLVNLQTHEMTRVAVKTHLCSAIAAYPSWNPSKTAFAFSASGTDGEGSQWPYDLWIKTSVACPH